MMDGDPKVYEVAYRGSHTCCMSSTVLSIGLPPSSVADQISPEVTQLSMDSLGSGSLMTVGPLPSVADQISSDVTQLSMDSLGRGSFMTVSSGSSGADLSTEQSDKEVEHPVADMADEMFYSDNSSSSSMDFLFQPPEDDK